MVNKKTQYLQAAFTLACTICRDAIWSNKSCNWIGNTNEDFYGMPKNYAKALGTNFYDGTAGVAFFLTAMLQLQKNTVIEKTVAGAFQQIIDKELQLQSEHEYLYGKLGFYTGWPGCIYVLLYAANALNRPDYYDAARQLTEKCMQLPEQYWGLDIIDGAAGAITAFAAIYRKQPDARLKDFIVSLGAYLLTKADKKPGSISWDTMAEKTNNLTGYAHGAAGFAHAFTELYNVTEDEAYLKIVRDIVAYEDGHFNSSQQNWPDFRKYETAYAPAQSTEQVCGVAWCHGAPGIGLSRLRSYQITHDVSFIRDVDIAVQTTIKAATADLLGNYSLCHGLFGNAELLLCAADVFQRAELRQQAEQLGEECFNRFILKQLPLPNGLQTLSDTPDFMLGSSGIGYFFLRLVDPKKFPCMLLISQ
ncbi:MAG: hypothetical protein M3040_18490 [Bacteroidota bacterium]|nr:hypothetical protein [Bacteroidota bacterium]